MAKNNKVSGLAVQVGDNFNSDLRKFKKKVDDSGILIEYLKRQYYEKPTTERKRKKSAARARHLKQIQNQQLPKKLF